MKLGLSVDLRRAWVKVFASRPEGASKREPADEALSEREEQIRLLPDASRHLEDQHRRAQQRVREIVASSPAVLFTAEIADDQVQSLSWTSDNLFEILGYRPEAAIGADWALSNVHPEDVERVKSQTNTELFTFGRSTIEFRFRHGDGRYCWTRSDMRLIRDETGRPSEVVGAWSDITGRKRAEEEQSRLREELQQAQKLESAGRLAGGVAHDFNNLLTVINGYSTLILNELTPGNPMHERVTEIRKASQQAEALVRQLMILSQKEITPAKVVNLNDVIIDAEKMLARLIGEDIRLETVLSPSLGYVLADTGQLHQILMNLAVNARDAMPGGGTLLIETRNVDLDEPGAERRPEMKPGPYVQLMVKDTGAGMKEDVISHIFDLFFTTKKPGEGTGFGLSIVYGIVKQSGGSIFVDSQPGEGTAFTIYFPRVDTAVKPQQDLPSPPPSMYGTETVLVVEEQEQLRKLVGRVLQSHGYRALEAANPWEALLRSERYSGPIHLLLTDVVMPEMTGHELASRMKPLRPSMKVVFMSGYSERGITDRQILELAGSYLQKPFSPEALAGKVREVLGPLRHAGTVLVADDEPGIRALLRKVLSDANYQVLEAQNGREAAQRAAASEIDMVIIDLAMPEQEAIETIRILRRVGPQLKIVAMSGEFVPLLGMVKRLGADGALTKPIQPDELLDIIARVIAS
jgi:two-component system, cell cycle sensor histidine kinase and response regulator CckA